MTEASVTLTPATAHTSGDPAVSYVTEQSGTTYEAPLSTEAARSRP